MLRWLAGSMACAAVALTSAATADTRPTSAFPLAAGNRWTLRDADSGAPLRVSIRPSGRSFVLRGFPGADGLRVRPRGAGVEAWDRVERRWEPFLRLGARAGTTYWIDLAGTSEWRSVRVTIAARGATVVDYRGRARRGCVLVELHPRVPINDAGLQGLAFAPGVGPVRIAQESFIGLRVHVLDSYRVRP